MPEPTKTQDGPIVVKTWDYIRQLFRSSDPVALFLINSKTGDTEQKVRSAEQLASPEFQSYLRGKNANGFNVHISMNPIIASFAVRLIVPNDQLEQVQASIERDPSLAGYRQQTQEQENSTHLTWIANAATIPAAKAEAEKLAQQVRKQLPEGNSLTIQSYQQHHRLKEDVREVRRLFLDLDDDGPLNLKRIFADVDQAKLPIPNYVVTTSPNKYQVIWTVEAGLSQQDAEATLRTLAREYGGDPACSDVSRVLRLPGLHNKKYDQYTPVRGECWTREPHKISEFACVKELAEKHAAQDIQDALDASTPGRERPMRKGAHGNPGSNTNSHQDWHHCCRAAERTIYQSAEKQVDRNLERTYVELQQWLEQNASDKHTRPDRYAAKTISKLRAHIAPKIPQFLAKRRVDTGLVEADQKCAEILKHTARSYSANPQSGLYIGPFIGETSRHYLQYLTPQTVIAHKKEQFSQGNVPEIGKRYTIRYANGALSASQWQNRSDRAKAR